MGRIQLDVDDKVTCEQSRATGARCSGSSGAADEGQRTTSGGQRARRCSAEAPVAAALALAMKGRAGDDDDDDKDGDNDGRGDDGARAEQVAAAMAALTREVSWFYDEPTAEDLGGVLDDTRPLHYYSSVLHKLPRKLAAATELRDCRAGGGHGRDGRAARAV